MSNTETATEGVEEARLARMFPSMAQEQTAAQGQTAKTAAPPPVDASDETPEERMFGSPETLRTMYGPALKDSLDRLSDAAGVTPEQRQAHLEAVAEVFTDARINSQEAPGLHSLLVTHLTAPPDDATVQQWEVESRRGLRERYGDDAGRRLAQASAFVKARPEMADILNRSGLGSHPRVILALAERVNEMRMTPRKRK